MRIEGLLKQKEQEGNLCRNGKSRLCRENSIHFSLRGLWIIHMKGVEDGGYV